MCAYQSIARPVAAYLSAAENSRTTARAFWGRSREAMQKALLRERALGYYVPSGRYWQELERFDIEALKSLDQMWLAAVNHRAAAA